MIKICGWMVVLGIISIILLTALSPFIDLDDMSYNYAVITYVIIISSIGLIFSLIVDRIKRKEEEDKDDYRKY
ncbi:hypothetical protein PV797_07405 [Clostridiaceae bacterium M8S5]|nr:hypothetical protein PV797_07405 [Clostridiaceae bacterium M8S5]